MRLFKIPISLFFILISVSLLAQSEELNFTGTVIFQDDFDDTKTGDFPAKFVSSAGGEVVSVKDGNGLLFYPNSNVLPDINSLPENFALEFDLTLKNVPPSLHNTFFNVYIQEKQTLKHNDAKNKFGAFGFSLWGGSKDRQIDIFNKKAKFDIEEKIPYNVAAKIIENTNRFTALINGSRLRLFINGEKIADSPNLLSGLKPAAINFRLNGTKKEEDRQFIISNVKITQIEKDLRSQLLEEGRFITSNILFASGSSKIESTSFELLNKIGKVIESSNASFIITGHTDSDGDEKANQKLSEERAQSVMKYLLNNFSIKESQLSADGKGESQPIADNKTVEGKKQNRRVEFKKQ